MRAIQLHEKYTEEIIGSVLLGNGTSLNEVTKSWDEYQKNYNSNLEDEPCIYEFTQLNGDGKFTVLDMDFYQPN